MRKFSQVNWQVKNWRLVLWITFRFTLIFRCNEIFSCIIHAWIKLPHRIKLSWSIDTASPTFKRITCVYDKYMWLLLLSVALSLFFFSPQFPKEEVRLNWTPNESKENIRKGTVQCMCERCKWGQQVSKSYAVWWYLSERQKKSSWIRYSCWREDVQ